MKRSLEELEALGWRIETRHCLSRPSVDGGQLVLHEEADRMEAYADKARQGEREALHELLHRALGIISARVARRPGGKVDELEEEIRAVLRARGETKGGA